MESVHVVEIVEVGSDHHIRAVFTGLDGQSVGIDAEIPSLNSGTSAVHNLYPECTVVIACDGRDDRHAESLASLEYHIHGRGVGKHDILCIGICPGASLHPAMATAAARHAPEMIILLFMLQYICFICCFHLALSPSLEPAVHAAESARRTSDRPQRR